MLQAKMEVVAPSTDNLRQVRDCLVAKRNQLKLQVEKIEKEIEGLDDAIAYLDTDYLGLRPVGGDYVKDQD